MIASLIHANWQTLILYIFQDWTDYDEKVSESVGIYEVTHQFKKCWCHHVMSLRDGRMNTIAEQASLLASKDASDAEAAWFGWWWTLLGVDEHHLIQQNNNSSITCATTVGFPLFATAKYKKIKDERLSFIWLPGCFSFLIHLIRFKFRLFVKFFSSWCETESKTWEWIVC